MSSVRFEAKPMRSVETYLRLRQLCIKLFTKDGSYDSYVSIFGKYSVVGSYPERFL